MTNNQDSNSTQKPSIWVDADACPNPIRDVLIRASKRTSIRITFVANRALSGIPNIPTITQLQVSQGFDVADNLIVERVADGDLVITQDIPLADEVIDKGAIAFGPRGQTYDKESIKQRLNMRDFMETMRSSGIQSGGPAALNAQDVQTFANKLDRWITKNFK
jgi:uncharacterized protein YaiI (UPF0178 family)